MAGPVWPPWARVAASPWPDAQVPGDVALVVIEPATEGRLAAALARWDEGPLAPGTRRRRHDPVVRPRPASGPARSAGSGSSAATR